MMIPFEGADVVEFEIDYAGQQAELQASWRMLARAYEPVSQACG
jgi:hypothetical protein